MNSLLLFVSLLMMQQTNANKCCVHPAVRLLQRYVKINTTVGNNQSEAIKFWKGLAEKSKASFNTYDYIEGYPIIVLKWKGSNSLLSSIVLLSHIDVVPVANETEWKHPPFSGKITKDGLLYGRGSQDCKSSSIQYYQAIRRLNKQKIKLQRDIYLILLSDHENGVTEEKLQPFIESKDFKNMFIGGGIDEGVSYKSDKVLLFYQDKALIVLEVDCYGIETHGSLMPDSHITAIGKCAKVIESLQEYRDEQLDYMKKLQVSDTGNFTSINLNILKGAVTDSVLPGRITLRYYINPSTSTTVSKVFNELKERIGKLGSGIKLTIVRSAEKSPAAKTDDTNPYWKAISDGAKSANITFNPSVIFDQSNAGIMRKFGIPILGFSPLQKTEFLVHGINENINITTFLNGINLYEKSIQNLANLSEKDVAKDTSSYLTGYNKKH